MPEITEILTQDVLNDHEYIVSLRRFFHMHPELAREEFITQQRIEEELDNIGIEHKRIAGTGVYAEIKGERPGTKTIVLRADIDGLPVEETNDVPYKSLTPGRKHACGHDAHNASLIGAA
ncbi:MAG: amidohydrolase, partial [Lachnospiraceae bacterium]|nr:amidohydrolase [Lachnospiraceae bacterium]